MRLTASVRFQSSSASSRVDANDPTPAMLASTCRPPSRVDGRRHRLGARGRVGDVATQRQRRARRACGVLVDVDAGDASAFAREPLDRGAPDAATGARHQRDSVVEAAHWRGKLAVACLCRQRSLASPAMVHELDLARMRRERVAKIQAQMEREGLDALYLLTSGNVLYAGGAWMLAADNGRAAFERTTTLIVRGDDHPHVFTPYPEGAPPELPARPPARAAVARHRRRGRGARAHDRRHRWAAATRAGSRSTTTPRRCGSASPSCSHPSSSPTPLPCSPRAACTRRPTSSSACAARGRSTKVPPTPPSRRCGPGSGSPISPRCTSAGSSSSAARATSSIRSGRRCPSASPTGRGAPTATFRSRSSPATTS